MNNIPEEETSAAGTGMENRRGEGSILVALLRGAGSQGAAGAESHMSSCLDSLPWLLKIARNFTLKVAARITRE
jgi:hypothetical protein